MKTLLMMMTDLIPEGLFDLQFTIHCKIGDGDNKYDVNIDVDDDGDDEYDYGI